MDDPSNEIKFRFSTKARKLHKKILNTKCTENPRKGLQKKFTQEVDRNTKYALETAEEKFGKDFLVIFGNSLDEILEIIHTYFRLNGINAATNMASRFDEIPQNSTHYFMDTNIKPSFILGMLSHKIFETLSQLVIDHYTPEEVF